MFGIIVLAVYAALMIGVTLIFTRRATSSESFHVADRRIVTANGTGSLEFAKEMLLLLENDTPEQIENFYRFNKLGYVEVMRQMKQRP